MGIRGQVRFQQRVDEHGARQGHSREVTASQVRKGELMNPLRNNTQQMSVGISPEGKACQNWLPFI